jgi:glucan biosynthesis protein C
MNRKEDHILNLFNFGSKNFYHFNRLRLPTQGGSMNSAPPSPRGRFAYIDWLRFFVVLSLAPFHAAISFTGMGSVYVYDTPVRDILLAGRTPVNMGPLALTIFTVFMDNWFMHLLFLVSGIGAALSLQKRSGAQFMEERYNKLLLYILLSTLLIVSVQSWLRALSFGRFSGSFFAFFPLFFNGIYTGPQSSGNFDWGHLWFLAYLFVFSALALPLFLSIRRKDENSRFFSLTRRFAGMPLIPLPALWTGSLEALFRPGWQGSLNLINDWANFTIYLSFFLAGYIIGAVPELPQAIEKHRLAALILGATAFLARLATYRVVAVPDGYNAANIVAQAFRGIAAYGLVLAAMGYGHCYLNGPSRILGIARDLSFPLYILHYAPLTAATYLLLNSGLSIWTRWILAVAASWSFVALFTFLARFVPPVRSFFSIRQPVVKTPQKTWHLITVIFADFLKRICCHKKQQDICPFGQREIKAFIKRPNNGLHADRIKRVPIFIVNEPQMIHYIRRSHRNLSCR